MKPVITFSMVTECLKHTGYVHLPLPVGDGITDDTAAIQARENAGLPWSQGTKGTVFRITKTIVIGGGT